MWAGVPVFGISGLHGIALSWYTTVMTTTQKIEYTSECGTRIVGPTQWGESSYSRVDEWIPVDPGERNRSGAPIYERTAAARHDDVSNVHPMTMGGYDPLCGRCWLHYSHTEDVHTENVRSNTI
jgi:hypothetical protein